MDNSNENMNRIVNCQRKQTLMIKVTIFRRQHTTIALLSALQTLINMIPMMKVIFFQQRKWLHLFSATGMYMRIEILNICTSLYSVYENSCYILEKIMYFFKKICFQKKISYLYKKPNKLPSLNIQILRHLSGIDHHIIRTKLQKRFYYT